MRMSNSPQGAQGPRQNAGMALYDVEKSEAEESRGQELDAVETRQIEYNGGLRLVD